MRRAFTLIELLVVIAIIVILFALLGDFQALVALAVGWVRYPLRMAGERNVDWPAVLTCAVCLIGLAVGVHGFGRWFAGSRPTPTVWPTRRTLKLIALVVTMFLAGIAGIGVTHEIVWLATTNEPLTSSRSGARTQSLNNLKQLALAAHTHHDIAKTLPAGAIFDANGRALHGWQTAILPYIEQAELQKKIDLTLPWDHPKNAPAMNADVYVFVSPFIGVPAKREGFGQSHYAGNIHVLGAKPMKLGDITDGTSNTLLYGEVADHFKPWGMPMNCRDPSVGLNVPHGFANPRATWVLFAFADGTVRTIRADVSPEVLRALSTPRGGEKFDIADLDH